MSRVIILEPDCYAVGVEKSLKFGDGDAFVYIVGDGETRPPIFDTVKFTERVLDALENLEYDPNNDVFVLVGAQVPLAITVAAIAGAYGTFKCALYSSREQNYLLREIGCGTESETTV